MTAPHTPAPAAGDATVPAGAAGFYVSVRTGARIAQSALALGPVPRPGGRR